MPTLSDQLRYAHAKAKRLAKQAAMAKSLEAEVVELRVQLAAAQQSAADQHMAMKSQDHVHADELARLEAKLDRLLVAVEAVLKRAGMPIAPVATERP